MTSDVFMSLMSKLKCNKTGHEFSLDLRNSVEILILTNDEEEDIFAFCRWNKINEVITKRAE